MRTVISFVPQLKVCQEQQAQWESQRADLEQRVEDGEEKADKLEKYYILSSLHPFLFVIMFLFITKIIDYMSLLFSILSSFRTLGGNLKHAIKMIMLIMI